MYLVLTNSNYSGAKYMLVYPYNLLSKLLLNYETNLLFKILAYPLPVSTIFYGSTSPWLVFYSYKYANDDTKVSKR